MYNILFIIFTLSLSALVIGCLAYIKKSTKPFILPKAKLPNGADCPGPNSSCESGWCADFDDGKGYGTCVPKRANWTWCDSGPPVPGESWQCESGVCGWVVKSDGDLDMEQCCDKKSWSGMKFRYLCGDLPQGHACYRDDDCKGKHACKDHHCT